MSRIKREKEAKKLQYTAMERTANTDIDKCSPQFKPTDIPEKEPNGAARFTFLQNFCFAM